MSNLKKKYTEEVVPQLKEKFGYPNPMLIPKLEKIVINMGIADAARDKNVVQDAVRELTMLAGQAAVSTRAKRAVSNFKLRQGMPIGAKVTLRGKRMFDFLERFIHLTSPRVRDFRGHKRKCNGGVYTVGLNDQQVFPEIDLDAVKRTQGMDICIVTSSQSSEETESLLEMLGFPFKKVA